MSKRREFEGQSENASPSGLKKPRVAGSAQPSFLPPRGDLESVAQPSTSSSAVLPSRPNAAPAASVAPGSGANLDAIAAARAKVAAKFAAFQAGGVPGRAPPSLANGSQNQRTASTIAASQSASANTGDGGAASPGAAGSGSGASATIAAIAEARKRIEAMRAKTSIARSGAAASAAAAPIAISPAPDSSAPSPGIHPLLAQNNDALQARSAKDKYKPMAPKFATIKANLRQSTPSHQSRKQGGAAASTSAAGALNEALANGVNPYYDQSIATENAPRERSMGKALRFNAKGKYTRLAEQMRQEQKLEALKQRIAEASKKAGLEAEIESGALIKRPAPPDVEWWDQAYLPNKTYEDLPDPSDDMDMTDEVLKIIDLTSVSSLIQHPIPIPAPGDKRQQAPKQLFLTKKEMKKLRRNRRAAEHKDQQDRIRMGLAPPPPDKVKISNMYRVLTQEAVADPTKIEARVRREMMARQNAHDKTNAERKLTEEQRREKIEKQKEKDESKGIHAAVFKVRYLSDGGHKFKVRKNAEQHNLSGVLIFNPKFNLVYVEGGAKAMRAYTRLMMERIKWTEATPNRGVTADSTPTLADGEGAGTHAKAGGGDEGGGTEEEPQNLAENYCYMVWEGEIKERAYRGFRPKACPADALAKEFLGAQSGMWDVARRYNPDDE